MEAAKRMFDNSYNQRLETAALAKAYLENPAVELTVDDEIKTIKKARNGRVCSIIGIIGSLCYCLIIFGLLLMPLIKTTEIHRKSIENERLKTERSEIQEEIDVVLEQIKEKRSRLDFKELAKEQGFITRDERLGRTIEYDQHISLEDARKSYYDKSFGITSNRDLD